MHVADVVAWVVRDSGLVTAPDPYRRLPGLVRHHAGRGEPWPNDVVLTVRDGQFHVTDTAGEAFGRWDVADVTARLVSIGPPVTFVVQVPGGTQLLGAASGSGTEALLAALSSPAS